MKERSRRDRREKERRIKAQPVEEERRTAPRRSKGMGGRRSTDTFYESSDYGVFAFSGKVGATDNE